MVWRWTLWQLRSKSWRSRREASSKLRRSKTALPRRAVKPLIVALNDYRYGPMKDERYVRESILEALGRIGDPSAIGPLLRAALKESHFGHRSALLSTLKRIDIHWAKSGAAKDVVPECVAALKGKNDWERCFAAYLLGEIGEPETVAPLVAALENRRGLDAAAQDVLGALIKLGPVAVHPLLLAVKDLEPQARQTVAGTLAKIDPEWRRSEGADAAVPSLVSALGDSASAFVVQEAAAETLAELGATVAIPALMVALKRRMPGVRRAAANALDRLGWRAENDTQRAVYAIALEDWPRLVNLGQSAVEPLVAALPSEEAAKALGEIGDPRAVEPLMKYLGYASGRDKRSVATALGQLGDARAVRALVEEATNPYAGEAATVALRLVLERAASSVATDDLRAVVHLRQVVTGSVRAVHSSCGSPESYEDPTGGLPTRIETACATGADSSRLGGIGECDAFDLLSVAIQVFAVKLPDRFARGWTYWTRCPIVLSEHAAKRPDKAIGAR